jgi:undecaprenyl-phosphate 4-deoxy-4-formamido-L-arabinose transferase
MSDLDLSVVIPVYRSRDSLGPLTDRLLVVLNATGLDYEIVFVEDGSPDDSWHVLRQIQAKHADRILAIQLMRNFGQHNALMCGFRHCRGRYVVTMDDDLQNPPEEIPKLLSAIEAGDFDLVYGRYGDKRHDHWRNIGSWLVSLFFRATFKTSISVTSFRVIRRQLLESIFPYDLNYSFVDGLLAWNTQRIGAVDVEHRARDSGRSGYNLFRLMTLAFNLFTNFSLMPLHLVSTCGLLAAAGGFLLALVYLARYLLSSITVPGYASIIISILVMGGIQLISLGIMGEYLGRLHLNVNRKPQYTVRQVAGCPRVEADADRTNQ